MHIYFFVYNRYFNLQKKRYFEGNATLWYLAHVLTIGLKVKAVPLHAMHALGGEELQLLLIFTSSLHGEIGQRNAPAALYPRERTPGNHWLGGCVGPRAGLDKKARGKILKSFDSAGDRTPVVQSVVETVY
jgi:hypothetical protein